MASASGNHSSNVASNSAQQRSGSQNGSDDYFERLQHRITIHNKLHDGSKSDLETPSSVIANVNIKQLLTTAAFDLLPTIYQEELIKLLPESDRLTIKNGKTKLAMTVNALSNEFFAKSCVEYRDRLRNGEFVGTSSSRTDVDSVSWQCDVDILRTQLIDSGVPKAGAPYIATLKDTSTVQPKKPSKGSKRPKANAHSMSKKFKSHRSGGLEKTAPSKSPSVSSTVLAHESRSKPSGYNLHIGSVKRSAVPGSVTTILNPPISKTVSIVKPPPALVTKLHKVTESNANGQKLTRVVPIIVRNPHDQVVTTLANCNPLLTQMINNPMTCVTPTTIVNKPEKKTILPNLLKRSNPTLLSVKLSSNGFNHDCINKAVTNVLAKIQSPQSGNAPSLPSQNNSAVCCSNGSANSSRTHNDDVNMEKSIQICESSKQSQPTLNLERSYEICKQVLGNSGTPNLLSVMVGAGGKKTSLLSKPVRSRPLQQAGSINNMNMTSSVSEIPIYRNKHHGKPSVTLSGHVFLAMKTDADGYASKAYKRKTAFKQKPKKKCTKPAVIKKPSVSAPGLTAQNNCDASGSIDEMNSHQVAKTPVRCVTTVTDTLHATEPIPSVSESQNSLISDNKASLLTSCICNMRALIICQKCGSFNHAECMSKEFCLACLVS